MKRHSICPWCFRCRVCDATLAAVRDGKAYECHGAGMERHKCGGRV